MKRFKFISGIIAYFFILKVGIIAAQTQIQSNIISFMVNGATDTYVTCVNDSNDIAGYFYNGLVERGFIYFASTADTIIVNYPGSQNTRVFGINNNKIVVGSYNTTGNIADNIGFKYTHSILTYEETTNWLSHTHKVSRDINDAGCIVGDHRTNPSTSVCHISCGGNNTIFHYNYNSSFINGINNSGKAVGFWMDAPNNYGFIRTLDGSFSVLNYPGANRTRLMGINDSSIVVGTFDLSRSFIYKHGVFSEIVKSGVTDIQVQDINNYGFIVGFYRNANNNAVGFYMPNCDIGFRPNSDGWQFSNSRANLWPKNWWEQFDYNYDPYRYGQAPFPKIFYNDDYHAVQNWLFPDWKLFVETFGENQCYEVVKNIPIVKNSVFKKWYVYIQDWGGSCNGFTQSAYMVWNDIQEFKWNYPGVGPWGVDNMLYELPVNYHNRRCINQLQFKQWQKSYYNVINNNKSKTPNETLKELKISLLDNSKDERGLVVYNQNPGGGAHIVNPYKIEIDTLNPNIEYIYVYDSNQPSDTNRYITVDKSKNAWYYFLSINAGVGQDQWGGDHANKGMFLYPPASSFYNELFIDSLKNVDFSKTEKNNKFTIYNSTSSNIIIKNQNSQITSYVNNILQNEIQEATPLFRFVGKEAPFGFILTESLYNIEMRDFSNSLVTFSLNNDINHYYYTRSDALLYEKDKFIINSNGITLINDDNNTKMINVQSISDDNGEEKTFFIYQIQLNQNSNLHFSILNNDILKVVNEGTATKYNLEIQYISSANTGIFKHDSIIFDANTTHVIDINWSNIQNSDVAIYIDNGNNNINEDTLYFGNQGIPIIITNPTLIMLNEAAVTDTIFIGNMASGTLSWDASSDANTWLNIIGNNSGSDFGHINYSATANLGGERTAHIIINAPNAANSPYVIEVIQKGILTAPTNLSASDGAFSDGVHVSWDAVAGATHYMVYRSNIAGSNGSPLTEWITSTNYIDSTSNDGDFYYYSVKAAQDVSGLNETGFSNIDDGWRTCFTASFKYMGGCTGQPVIFTNTSSVRTSAFYLWDIDNNGIIDYTTEDISHIFATAGSKTIVLAVTDSILCNSTYQETIEIIPFPSLNLVSDTIVCADQSITLNAGNGFNSYLWSTGGTSAEETIDSTGFGLGCVPVYVSVTNDNGCTTIDTVLINWTICTETPVVIPPNEKFNWLIYPNPANEYLNVHFEGRLSNVQVNVYNFCGQLVYEGIVEEIIENHTQIIDIRYLRSGIYFVRCMTDNIIDVKKLVIY